MVVASPSPSHHDVDGSAGSAGAEQGPGSLDAWSTERLEAELVSWAARESAAKARFLQLLAEFVRREAWEAWGCVSAVQWLSWHCGLGRVAAGEHLRVARALPDLPAIAAGLADGALTWSKVRAVTRVADRSTDEQWAEWAREATAAQLESLVAAARRMGADDVESQGRRHGLSWRQEGDGSVVLTWRVTAEIGAAVIAAVEKATVPAVDRPVAQVRGSALTDLVLGDEIAAPEVVVHVTVEAETQPETETETASATGAGSDGPATSVDGAGSTSATHRAGDRSAVSEQGVAVPIEVAGVGICDGVHRVVVREPDGGILVSDRRRSPTARVRRALGARDRWCRMPGCHHEDRLEIHHIEEYHRGGSRRLDNLVRVCAAHHRLLHRYRLRLAWTEDGAVQVLRPDGSALPESVPRLMEGEDDSTGRPVTPWAVEQPPQDPSAPWDGRRLDHASIDAALLGMVDARPAA